MKKGILCFFISSVLLCPYPELSAQGFFKKIAKGVENASKELEKATDKLSGAKQVTINNTSVTYSSPSSILKIDVDKVEMQGDKLILEFMLTNISDIDIRSYRIGCDFTKDNAKTYAIDNLGGRATVVVYLADKEPNRGGGYLGTNIPAGIPLRAIVRIGEINPKATSITQLRIDGHDWSNGNARKELNGGFVFKNIPIVRPEIVKVSFVGKTVDSVKESGYKDWSTSLEQGGTLYVLKNIKDDSQTLALIEGDTGLITDELMFVDGNNIWHNVGEIHDLRTHTTSWHLIKAKEINDKITLLEGWSVDPATSKFVKIKDLQNYRHESEFSAP